MIFGSNIPDDGILRIEIDVPALFAHVRRRRTRKKKIARCLRNVDKHVKRRRGWHDWAESL
jgi:hypothetical protein